MSPSHDEFNTEIVPPQISRGTLNFNNFNILSSGPPERTSFRIQGGNLNENSFSLGLE